MKKDRRISMSKPVLIVCAAIAFTMFLSYAGDLNYYNNRGYRYGTCNKFCVNGNTTVRRKYGLYERSFG
jgi:hypothetical protein